MLRRIFKKVVHKISKLDSNLYIKFLKSKGCSIGNNVKFHGRKNVDITRPHLIQIGNNVVITDDVHILTHGYDWYVLRNFYRDPNIIGSAGKVSIGNNVFIGTKTIILKGITIGDNVIIGAGITVTKDIPSCTVCAGMPAKVILDLNDYYKERLNQVPLEFEEELKHLNSIDKATEHNFTEFFHLFKDRKTPLSKTQIKQLGNSYNNYMKSKPKFKI